MSRQPAQVRQRRMRLGLAVILVLFVGFGLRLFQIQAFDTTAYAAMARDAGTRSTTVPADRGEILDRNGAPLAASIGGLTLTADPTLTGENAPQIARILKEKLADQVDYFDLIDLLRAPNSRFEYLAKDVPEWQADAALDALRKAKLTGVFTERESLRTYPGRSLAANLIGYTNADGQGVAGLERQYEKRLAGQDGASTRIVSPSGQRIPLSDSEVTPMVPGQDVITTIDSDLQWYADQRLAEAVQASGSDWGLAITMDVRTCQIMQISQAPTFDLADPTSRTDATTVARSLQTVYEPGSVLKTVTMAALADQGKVTPETQIVVPGEMKIDGFTIGDYWDHGTLRLTAAGVIAKSSNLGTIVAAEQMSDQTFHDYLTSFGFGRTTGVGLPGESSGILADAPDWSRAKHATVSFGQGISVTALQVVRAVGAIANGGQICTPSVVSGFRDDDGHMTAAPSEKPQQIISTEAAREVTRMMEAVTSNDGTAPAAQIPGYRVAGKTGTAWRVDPNTGRYIRGQNTVSFLGFAPADAPRFLTYIVLDRPGGNAGGGSTAAPVFHDIMSMALERFAVPPTGAPSPDVPQQW